TWHVTSEGVERGGAGLGLMILLGENQDDNEKDALYMAEKIANMRIFEDDRGKMNRSLVDIGVDMLVVSQFSLCGDARHGRRPYFTEAAPTELAEALYEKFVSAVSAMGIRTATGRFRTEMVVSLENHGPVTILVDSKKLF
uniref:D-aminoacyl-tRNA deacylase n=1 Tax=Megasphaera stantonii TaxID=2144175 RepID=UPI000D16099C